LQLLLENSVRLHLFEQGCEQSPSPPKAVRFPSKRQAAALSFSEREIGFAFKQGVFLGPRIVTQEWQICEESLRLQSGGSSEHCIVFVDRVVA
jgi:hypothetical protein